MELYNAAQSAFNTLSYSDGGGFHAGGQAAQPQQRQVERLVQGDFDAYNYSTKHMVTFL